MKDTMESILIEVNKICSVNAPTIQQAIEKDINSHNWYSWSDSSFGNQYPELSERIDGFIEHERRLAGRVAYPVKPQQHTEDGFVNTDLLRMHDSLVRQLREIEDSEPKADIRRAKLARMAAHLLLSFAESCEVSNG